MAREWLINEREKRNMSIPQMADFLGLKYDSYYKIENGDRQKKMDITMLARLSAALDIPIAKIVEMEVA